MTLRDGIVELVAEMRQLTDSGTADYQVGTVSYFSDDQLQTTLDHYRTNFQRALEHVHSGIYHFNYAPFVERAASGTAIFNVQDSAGLTVDPTLYSVDYAAQTISFDDDPGGVPFTLNARAYDVFRAASRVWIKKAGLEAGGYDINTDNHGLQRSQKHAHCMAMARFYADHAAPILMHLQRVDARG